MEILSLQLENTKSYISAQIEFTPGVNAIVGHNGAGKSTILEAIGFVLFDSLGYSHKEFVRAGAKQATITVTIVSHSDERRYQVVRRCGSSTQYYIFDPDLQSKICEGKADVLRFLRQHMGVEVNGDLTGLFCDAVGVPQGAFTAAFLQTPVQRKAVFDRLLQVEEYKEASDKLREPQRLLRERQQQLDVKTSALLARLERLPLLQAAIQQCTEQIQQAEQQQHQATLTLGQVQIERSALEQIQQQVLNLRNRQTQNNQLVQSLEQQQRNATTALQQARHAQTLVEQNQAAFARYQTAQTEQQQLDGQARQRQQIQSKQVALDRTLVAAQRDLSNLLGELAEVAAADALMVSLNPAVQEQERLEQALLAAKQASIRLDEANAALARQEREGQRLSQRVVELTDQLAQAAQLDQRQQLLETTIQTLRSTIDGQKETLATCKNEADSIKRQNSALTDITTATCPVCEQPLGDQQRRQMLARNEQRLQALRVEYKQQQDQLKLDEAHLQAQQSESQQLQQALRRLPRSEELAQAQQEQSTAESALNLLRAQVAQLATTPHQVAELTAQLATLGNPRQQQAIASATTKRRPQLLEKQTLLTQEVANKQAQLAELQQTLVQFAGLDAAMETVAQTLRQLQPAYETVLANRKMAETVVARTAEMEAAGQALTLAQQEAERIRSELSTVEGQFDPQHFQQLVSQEQQLRNQLSALQTQMTMLAAEQQRSQAEAATLHRQQAELEAANDQKQTLEEQEQILTAMRDLLRQAGPQVTKTLIRQVSNGAAQIFCDIMQDYTRHLTWHDDYGITLDVDGHERQFAQLSGGEQMSAALAVRLALLREMSNIDIAFFDEPTTNLDEARRDSLARQILEVKGFRQLFVISHDDTFEQATQNLIRVQRMNGVSSIVQSQ